MRFLGTRDFEYIQRITREVIDDVMDVPVVLYKIVLASVDTNIYGESIKKPRYTPVSLNAVVDYAKNKAVETDGFGPDQQQNVTFRFSRRLLSEVSVYPEAGDIVGYNGHFYEIGNVQEMQLIASKPQYSTAIICTAHLTRRTALDIEDRNV